MTFNMRDLISNPDRFDVYQCKTNKTGFDTKKDAQAALRLINPTIRHTMRSYRCDWCDRYHLGHRRGQRS